MQWKACDLLLWLSCAVHYWLLGVGGTGTATHIHVSHRALLFTNASVALPDGTRMRLSDILSSRPGLLQAGSFFPDWYVLGWRLAAMTLALMALGAI